MVTFPKMVLPIFPLPIFKSSIFASMIDLRSDTVTKPSEAMLAAMLKAPLGDDVFGEDASINALEARLSSMFKMEAALFCPSGTMTNQIAIKCHTQPGDEVVCDELSHIYQYEGGGIAFNSGCSVKVLKGDYGRINAIQVSESINNKNDVHKAYTSLVSLENTSNRGGGCCYDFEEIKNIRKVCDENNLKLHLDGARLFNALVAKKEKPEDYGKIFDSISICLSKGLGAPVGSVLLGKKDFIAKARRIRKVLGGGMRQAGVIASAGIFALENNVERLQEDHHHAKLIANTLARKNFVRHIFPVETNIVIFELADADITRLMISKLKSKNILALALSPVNIRLVTHLDIMPAMMDEVLVAINEIEFNQTHQKISLANVSEN